MTPTPPFDPSLIDRFLSGEANEAERAEVETWLAAHAENREFVAALRARFAATTDIAATDEAWLALRKAMKVPGDVRSLDAKRQEKLAKAPAKRSWTPLIRIAAGLMVVAGSAALWQTRAPAEESLLAPAGSTRVAMLSDGSRITLAPGSSARWRRDFKSGNREVQLDGEGYFEVVHDSLHPFKVRARNAVVEDVGTRFVVRAWPELVRPEVAVEEGVVLLADTSGVVAGQQLMAGQFGRLEADGRVTIDSLPEDSFAWLKNELVFNEVPLAVALPSIGRWHDVELRADSSLAGRQLSARFAAQSLSQILDALSLALDARVERNGRVITLVKRNP